MHATAVAISEPARPRHVPDLKHRVYADGMPIHQLQYLQVKLILRGERFTSLKSLQSFAEVVERAADASDVGFDTDDYGKERPRMREVLFLDTPEFLLYRNGFLLRRRLPYEDGFLVGDPEIVFKYRDSDLQKAAEVDVRPRIVGDYRVKFKAEALPLKNRIGGLRMLYSHNVQFPLSAVSQVDRRSMATVLEVLPVLNTLDTGGVGRIDLVSNAAVEELLLDIGDLKFGKGVSSTASVALWRTRGDLRQLVGEFSFQVKFEDRHELPDKAVRRAETFFYALQRLARDWAALGTTKTGTVYALSAHAPPAHE
jgi:hypothetical protein